MLTIRRIFRWAALIGAAAALFAGIPNNGITLTNNTGVTVNQPYTISRFFAQGEIVNYPKPNGISQWQTDVKTRWPDGSVQHALVSFWRSTANGASDTITFVNSANPCHLGNQATCTAAGLDAAGMLSFKGGSWGAAIQATQNSTTITTDAKTLIAGGYFKYWIRGPIATVAVIEDRSPARSYDFGWACSSVFRFTVDTAADTLTTYDLATGLTPVAHNFSSGQQVHLGTLTTPGPSPAFGSGNKGVANQFARNVTSTTLQLSSTATGSLFNFTTGGAGTNYITACGTFGYDYSTATWANDSTYRSLHPQFIATFFPGWNGVYEEYVVQNGWTTAIQDQRYGLALKNGSGNANTVLNKPITQYARTEWVYRAWDGAGTTLEFPTTAQEYTLPLSPPNFTIDLNKQYIIYSKLTPQLDPSLTVDPNNVYQNDFTLYTLSGLEPFTCQNGALNCGDWLTNFSSTGGRGDIGWVPRWYLRWLYTFDSRFAWLVRGNADLAGTSPYHLWESATGKWFDSGHTTDAFGYAVSVNARPTVREENGPTGWDQYGSASDKFTFVEALPAGINTGFMLSDNYGWGMEYGMSDPQHQPAWHYIPYLTSGDYFYLEDGLAYSSQFFLRAGNTARHNDWAISPGATRGMAWAQRSSYQMAIMTPDPTLASSSNMSFPEKAYYLEKANNQIPWLEALFGIPDGNYVAPCNANTYNPATETNKYCWSLFSRVGWYTNYNPWNLSLQRSGVVGDAAQQPPAAAQDAMYMASFMNLVMGWAAEMGLPTDRISRKVGRLWVEAMYSPWPRDVEQYTLPTALQLPTATLASAITSTSTSLTLTTPIPWLGQVDPPYVVAIENSGTNINEYVYICAHSGSTLTVCTNGRGAINATSSLGASSHSAGATIDFATYSPYLHSIADLKSGIRSGYENLQLPFNSFGNVNEGYANLAIANLSYAGDTYTSGHGGSDAFAKLAAYKADPVASGNYSFAGIAYNPQLEYLPRRDPIGKVGVQPGDTFAVIGYYAPSAGKGDSACTVDGVADGQSASRYRTFVKTGLTAGTPYTSTIHCAADYYDSGAGRGNAAVSYTTTGTLSGSKNFQVTLGAGSATAYLDFGPTPAFGSTASATCPSGCTLSATVPRGLLYYRVRRTTQNGPTAPAVIR
jgi:hypothetical protein